jgi:MFS family permease
MARVFKSWTDLGTLPRAVWVLVLASFVNRLGAMALPFLTLYLVRSAHLTVEAAGGMLVVYGGVALVVGPIAGRLCDHFGAARVMIGALAASGVVLCLYPLAHSVGALVVLTTAWSLSAETFRPASMTRMTAIVPPAQRKQAFAFLRLGVNLGMSVGPAAAGFLAEWSFPSIFLVDGATSLLGAGALLFAYEADSPPAANAPPRGWLPFRALADPKLALALAALFPLALLFFQNESSVPVLLVQERHFAPAVFGAMFTLNTILIVFCEIPLNAAIGKFSHRRVLAAGAAFGAVGFGCLALATNVVALAGAVILWTIGEMIYSPGIATYVAEIAPSDRRGEYVGLYAMTYAIAFVAAPWSGLLVLERLGTTALAIGMVAVGALSAVLFARLAEGGSAPAAAAESAPSAESSPSGDPG